MRYRQIHLDFHTSGMIPGIGKRFSKEQFQAGLRAAHADSITGTQYSDKVDKLLACVDEAEKHVRASGRRDADILLNCLDYKKIVLAGACRREGSMRGEQLFHDVLRGTPSRKVKAVLVSGYWLASRGVRGTARVAERLFRLF